MNFETSHYFETAFGFMELITTSTSNLSISPSEAKYETHEGYTYRVDPAATLSITGRDNETREYKKEEANLSKNGPQQLPGRHSEHKPHGLQGEKVLVDCGQQAGHNRVGTAEASRMQHGPVQVGTIRGIPEGSYEHKAPETTPIRSKMDKASGSTPRSHAQSARPTVRITYDPDKCKWVRTDVE